MHIPTHPFFRDNLYPVGRCTKADNPVAPPNHPRKIALGDENLPLPAPYPDYITCPHCGEPEVEIWCNEQGENCHSCGQWIVHEVPPDCKPISEENKKTD